MPRVAIIAPEKTPQPYRFTLDRQIVTIGRGSDNDIIIADPSVSVVHCTMERVSGGYILRDQNSTNGISLAGSEMEVIDLRKGDDVKVGDIIFEYSLADEELDELDQEEIESHEKKKRAAPANAPQRKLKSAAAAPPPAYAPPQPVLASSSSGSGMVGFGAFLLGVLALGAGLNNSYVSNQKKLGRKGEISFLGDLLEGKPPLPAEESEE